MTDSSADILARWRDVEARIRTAEADAERPSGATRLVAVSKGFGPEPIGALLRAGQRVFGENRVRDMLDKWPPLLRQYPDAELRFVGRLQSNKVADVLKIAHVIESVDRPSLAKALAARLADLDREVRILVQVNLGEEPQKGGCPPGEADEFIAWCRNDLGLALRGAMGMPPRESDPVPYFALLRSLCIRNGLEETSMGMSADFQDAIAMGATHVRVGTAVFGTRR